MSISQKYPSSYPSLYLNFAQSGQLDPRVSIARTSTGTYIDAEGILRTAGPNEPRFDYENGECKGLLIEGSRTNEFRNSEDLSSVQWTAINSTVSLSADTSLRFSGVYQITSTGSSPRIYNSTRIGGCYSYYVKKVDNSLVSITISPATEGGWGHIFNFDTGQFTYVNGGHRQWTANSIYIGNGWWRLWGYTKETVIYGDEIGIGPGDFRPSAGTQTGSILVTAPQNESGSFITSYIPNTSTSTAVTRAPDKVTINDLSWFDDYEGTFVVDTNLTGVSTTTTLFSLDNGSSQIIFDTTKVQVGSGNTLPSTLNTDISILGYSSSKNIVVSSLQDVSLASTITSLPTGLNRLTIGWDPFISINNLNGSLKSFRYYPTLLGDNQLNSLAKIQQNPFNIDDPNNILSPDKNTLSTGLLGKRYTGYFNDDLTYFTNSRLQGETNTTTEINNFTSNTELYSWMWLGYFYAPTSGSYTFYTYSDDASYLWLGLNAISGYTTGNALVNNGGLHAGVTKSGTINLSGGLTYPIRIMFGENYGADYISVSFTPPGSSNTTNGSGYYYGGNIAWSTW